MEAQKEEQKEKEVLSPKDFLPKVLEKVKNDPIELDKLAKNLMSYVSLKSNGDKQKEKAQKKRDEINWKEYNDYESKVTIDQLKELNKLIQKTQSKLPKFNYINLNLKRGIKKIEEDSFYVLTETIGDKFWYFFLLNPELKKGSINFKMKGLPFTFCFSDIVDLETGLNEGDNYLIKNDHKDKEEDDEIERMKNSGIDEVHLNPKLTFKLFGKFILDYILINKDQISDIEDPYVDIFMLGNDMVNHKPEILKDYNLEVNFGVKNKVAKETIQEWTKDKKIKNIIVNDYYLAKKIIENDFPKEGGEDNEDEKYTHKKKEEIEEENKKNEKKHAKKEEDKKEDKKPE